ncbi:hypothetical protein H9P43_008788 [Blastocladiella emersonii ATCC 22665]|nr:hypothetical protein H9P43_008788 [Blastocladiella emersonii ATCC 22665]
MADTSTTTPAQQPEVPPTETEPLVAGSATDDGAIAEGEQTAHSLRCDDCGKLFRNIDYAQLHNAKSGHVNFSESTEIIKPLTEEEKRAKVEELQRKLAERREARARQDAEEARTRERIRRKHGQEIVEAQEKLKEKEMLLAIEAKKREKDEDKAHLARVRAEIERDRQERLARKNGTPAASAPAPAATAAPPRPSAAAANTNTARIQIRGAGAAPLTHEFAADATLADVFTWLAQKGAPAGSLMTTFPRRTFGANDMKKSLRELDLVPSAALMFQKS